MKRFLLVSILFCSLSGCASEREYFFNHNPFTDTLLFLGNCLDGPSAFDDVSYSSDDPAEIRAL